MKTEVKMLGAKQAAKPSPYPMAADFCRIFEKDMSHLYLLSYLLTGDHRLAEECFVRGLDDAIKSNRVFKEWAYAWARRMIIQNAIHMIQPQAADERAASSRVDHGAEHAGTAPARIAAIVELPAFNRFVFVMSVLERYTDQDCSLLLSSTRAEVIAARTRALHQIAESEELQRQLSVAAADRTQRGERRSAFHPAVVSLAASA
jgi:DNA-directed RNA polymerase specialized sigma24 family protein